jgi:hypothetical protein
LVFGIRDMEFCSSFFFKLLYMVKWVFSFYPMSSISG